MYRVRVLERRGGAVALQNQSTTTPRCCRKIERIFQDKWSVEPYNVNMGGVTKQVKIQIEAQGNSGREVLSRSSASPSEVQNELRSKPYGALERLTRVLADIARHPTPGGAQEHKGSQ